MKKRIATLMLALVMLVSVVPAQQVQATGSATGQQIVERAMLYIGKVPYVWGGETLDGDNPGADCSGFICRIYEYFGFNLWANRTKLRNCGTNLGTDLSVAKLGDIIWFEGHVAIYAGVSNGNHMIVHETGGSYQNVVYTKVSVVKAELKGIIRIPGVTNDGETVSKASFALPTQSSYVSKQSVGETNAVVVNQITKLSGVKVTQMGLYLYNADGSLIKRYVENVSNVGNSTTLYHSWYDINAEVGVTLTPGTTYKYRFFGVFDGKEIKGGEYSFTTKGSAPAKTFLAFLYYGLDHSNVTTIEVTQGQAYGSIPKPADPEGYNFDGYYTAKTGGTLVTSSTIFNGSADVKLYAHYSEIPKEEVVIYYYDMNGRQFMTETTEIGCGYSGDYLVVDGYTFDGYYSEPSGGYKLTVITETSPRHAYARYTPVAVPHEIVLWIDVPVIRVDGVVSPIDSLGTTPAIINSRTMLPIRAVIEAMGGSVAWDADTKTVSLARGAQQLNLRIGAGYAWDSASTYRLDSPPVIVGGRTLLPVRAVVEYFGGTVSWDASLKAVTISYTD